MMANSKASPILIRMPASSERARTGVPGAAEGGSPDGQPGWGAMRAEGGGSDGHRDNLNVRISFSLFTILVGPVGTALGS
jgi:hypothetical protein